jgi:lipopolysaccharide transport system ATP-binding protein
VTAQIRLSGIGLDFPLHHGAGRSLKKAALGALRLGTAGRRTVVHALRGVSLELAPEDRLGLVGGNGAGKTTLLRVLAGILEPDRGAMHVSGSIGALLDPGLGMHPDLTGRENIRLRGLYHGLSGPALSRMADDVAAFAGLGEFLDLPTRTYSAGMAIRLGFALATAMRPGILLLDEWFLAGDAAFRDKAQDRLAELVHGAEIVVLASHEPAIIREWCNRAIWLEHGSVQAEGTPDAVLAAYAASRSISAPQAASFCSSAS